MAKEDEDQGWADWKHDFYEETEEPDGGASAGASLVRVLVL
jgi:hypothetical protein